jgi:aliphatic sulfonates family ABC transporter substrate-binding protein
MTVTRRIVLGSTAGALGALALSSIGRAQPAPPKEFRIGYQKGGILAVAKDQKTIEPRLKTLGVESVRWVEFQFGPPLLEALGLGSIDFGTVGDTPPIFAQAAGAKVVYVASTPASQSALLVPSDSPIRTLADIKGKKVAFARGSSSHNLTVQLLAKAKLEYTDITPVHLTPSDAVAAFARGAIDAWTVWDPYYAIAELRHKARAVATTKDVAESNSFYLANRDVANRHPNAVITVIDELRKTTEWAASNRDKLAAAISAVTGVEIEAQRRAVDRATIELRPSLPPEVIAQQQDIADTFFKLGLIPRQITVRDAIWAPPGA